MHQPSSLYQRHRFPGEVISHAVWLYYRFLLSYRDVEELLAERGIAISDETVRRWCKKVGQRFADGVRRRRPRPGDTWHSGAPPQFACQSAWVLRTPHHRELAKKPDRE